MNYSQLSRGIILPLLTALVLPLVQGSQILRFEGVNPNLGVIGLMMLAVMVAGYLRFFIFSAFLIFLLKIIPGFELESAALLGVALFMKLFQGVAPWSSFAAPAFSVIMGTTIFYAIGDYSFIIGEPGFFLKELLYNLILGVFAHLGLSVIYEEAR